MQIVARRAGVLSGLPVAEMVLAAVDRRIQVVCHLHDGAELSGGAAVADVNGPIRSLLTGERTALNFLTHLSGVATLTRRFVDVVAGTNAAVLDTRKTLPGWRALEKYAVRVGGCRNHRAGLDDGFLIKENHIAAAGGIAPAMAAAKSSAAPGVWLQIEVENLDELQQAINADAKMVLLDNFSLDEMRDAVTLAGGRIILEASGGISLDTLRAIAETGVDRISIGTLTKDVKALDLSMRFAPR